MKVFYAIAAVLLVVSAFSRADSEVGPKGQSIITVRNGGAFGTWGPIAMCPEDTVAVGFAIKVEGDLVLGDDTALNGIRLYCGNSSTSNQLTEVESTTQIWGSWGPRSTCFNNGYLTAFSLRVEAAYVKQNGKSSAGRAVDDTAANDVMFRCNTGEQLEGNGMYWGYWGDWSNECSSGICGIQTKVEANQGVLDDTALNDVQFYCC